MSKYITLLVGIFCWSISFGQYNISVKIDGLNCKDELLLANHFGDKQYLRDTSECVKGKATFRGDESLQNGVYLVVLPNKNYFEILISQNEDQTNYFFHSDINLSPENMIVKGSKENELFFEFNNSAIVEGNKADKIQLELDNLQDGKTKNKLELELKDINKGIALKRDKISQDYSELFIGKLYKSMTEIKSPDFSDKSEEDQQKFYDLWMREHFWDKVDFSEDGLVRSPIFHNRLKDYFDRYMPPIADTAIWLAEDLINKIEAAGSKEQYKYTIHFLLGYFENAEFTGFNKALWHIAKNYYCAGKAFWADSEYVSKMCIESAKMEAKFKNNEETVRYLKDKYENTIVTLYPEDETITEYTCIVDADCDEFYPPYFDEEENALWVKYIWTFTKESNFKYGTAYRIILDEKGEHSTLLLKVGVINDKSSGLNFYKWHGKKYSYYENGKLESESTFVNDEIDGQEVSYDKYGNVISTVEWNNGVKNNWTKDCSKTPCKYTFESYFNNKEEAENQGWSFNDNDKQKNYITSEAEYYFKNIKNSNFNHINLPINFNENFQASVYADYWNGSQNSWFGIIVGWEDWDNYVDLKITPNGYYQANIIKDGINFGMQDYKKLEGKTFYDWVKLNIVKSNGKLVFTINKKIVYISEFSKIIGEKCGLYNSGIKSVQFDDFKVTKYKANQTSKPKPDYSSKNQWAGNGSGIIISKNGLIATNNHVIKGSSEIEVEFLYNNEIKSFKAKVVKTDPTNDLAIIKIDDNAFTGLSSIRYNFKTRSSQVGESVFALGYPKALSLMGKEMKFTDGKISSKTGFQGDVTTYQTTTPIQPGNSGGPLFDYNGNFIGINSAKIVQDDVDNVSYSIKSLYLLTLIDALAESVELPSDNSISSLPLTTKIKKLEKYVTLIKVR